jgi:putative aldouronate transport system substrate-binding protein
MKRILGIISILMVVVFMVGCAKKVEEKTSVSATEEATAVTKETEEVKQEEKQEEPEVVVEPVTLKWIFYGEEMEDSKAVWSKVNEMLLTKLPGVQVEFQPIESAAYDDRSRLIVASGEAYDIMWAASWKGDATGKVAGGAFLPLDELISEYAPELIEAVPQFNWDKVTYSGKIMGVPSHQTVITGKAIKIPLDIYEAYKNIIPFEESEAFAIDTTKSAADILRLYEPFIEQVKKDGADQGLSLIGPGGLENLGKNYETFMNLGQMGFLGVSLDTREKKVVNLLESEDFKEYIMLAHEFANKGYFPKDIAATKNLPPTQIFAVISNANYDLDLPTRNQRVTDFFGREMKTIMTSGPINSGSGAASSANFIGVGSKHPAEAVKLLSLVNTDPELYNLIAYGVDGEHYQMEANTMKTLKETYKVRDWVIGNTDNSYKLAADKEYIEMVRNIYNELPGSIIPGFMFDVEPIKTQLASIEAINSEYVDALIWGISKDPLKLYDEYISELRNAGINEVKAEAQRQMDEWSKANK